MKKKTATVTPSNGAKKLNAFGKGLVLGLLFGAMSKIIGSEIGLTAEKLVEHTGIVDTLISSDVTKNIFQVQKQSVLDGLAITEDALNEANPINEAVLAAGELAYDSVVEESNKLTDTTTAEAASPTFAQIAKTFLDTLKDKIKLDKWKIARAVLLKVAIAVGVALITVANPLAGAIVGGVVLAYEIIKNAYDMTHSIIVCYKAVEGNGQAATTNPKVPAIPALDGNGVLKVCGQSGIAFGFAAAATALQFLAVTKKHRHSRKIRKVRQLAK